MFFVRSRGFLVQRGEPPKHGDFRAAPAPGWVGVAAPVCRCKMARAQPAWRGAGAGAAEGRPPARTGRERERAGQRRKGRGGAGRGAQARGGMAAAAAGAEPGPVVGAAAAAAAGEEEPGPGAPCAAPLRLARLPLARVKALVKADPDVTLASQEAVFVLARAAVRGPGPGPGEAPRLLPARCAAPRTCGPRSGLSPPQGEGVAASPGSPQRAWCCAR